MGQYHKTVNLDKREFIAPHKLGAGLKVWEQLAADIGPGKALVVLLSHPSQRGGGDLDVDENWHGPERKFPEHSASPGPMPDEYPQIAARTIGRWRGDRIAIIGDYAEKGDLPSRKESDPPESEIYGLCRVEDSEDSSVDGWKDITDDVCAVIEHELAGKFLGDGWRNFVRKGQRVWRWKGAGSQEKLGGNIKSLGESRVTVQWDGGALETTSLAKANFFPE